MRIADWLSGCARVGALVPKCPGFRARHRAKSRDRCTREISTCRLAHAAARTINPHARPLADPKNPQSATRTPQSSAAQPRSEFRLELRLQRVLRHHADDLVDHLAALE